MNLKNHAGDTLRPTYAQVRARTLKQTLASFSKNLLYSSPFVYPQINLGNRILYTQKVARSIVVCSRAQVSGTLIDITEQGLIVSCSDDWLLLSDLLTPNLEPIDLTGLAQEQRSSLGQVLSCRPLPSINSGVAAHKH